MVLDEVTVTDLPGLAPAPIPQGHPASSPTAAPSYRRRPLSAALDAGHSCLVLEEGPRALMRTNGRLEIPSLAHRGHCPRPVTAAPEPRAGFPGVV